jgi:hypothetical protein
MSLKGFLINYWMPAIFPLWQNYMSKACANFESGRGEFLMQENANGRAAYLG